MRTTIDLPEGLFRELKMRAVREGKTLKELVAECIRSGLQRPSGVTQEMPVRREPPPVAIRKNKGMARTAALSNRQLNAILEDEELEAVSKLTAQPDDRA